MLNSCEMRSQIETRRPLIISLLLLALLGWSVACQKTEAPAANANTTTTSTATASNSASPNSTNTTQTAAGPEPASSDADVSLATPTGTYQAGYTARQKKDIPLLKRVLSKDALAFLKDIAEADKKTLDDQLRALAETPQASSAETRNEKISGSRASLEYLDQKGKWVVMDFTKEGNEWKIDLPKGP